MTLHHLLPFTPRITVKHHLHLLNKKRTHEFSDYHEIFANERDSMRLLFKK